MKLISNVEMHWVALGKTTASKFWPAKSNAYLANEQFLQRGVIIRVAGTTPLSYIHPWTTQEDYCTMSFFGTFVGHDNKLCCEVCQLLTFLAISSAGFAMQSLIMFDSLP